jgi:hypothetical protein
MAPPPRPPDVADHDWFIEEREYERHEARRGRRHAFTRLDPRRTALVVVDLVPFFVRESAYVRGVVPRVNVLAGALRDAGGIVAWMVPGYSEPTVKDREFFGEEVAELYARSGGEGAPASRLAAGLAVAAEALVVEKTARSAWFPGSSELPRLLADRGVDTVVVTGSLTNEPRNHPAGSRWLRCERSEPRNHHPARSTSWSSSPRGDVPPLRWSSSPRGTSGRIETQVHEQTQCRTPSLGSNA